MPGTRWFEGARLNYAEHALRHTRDDQPALIQVHEDGSREETSWQQLREQVGSVATSLQERGIGPGDVVAAYVPNCAEAAIAYLACASIGATWASCAPDLSANAALDRFQQLRPIALIAIQQYFYAGKHHDRSRTIDQIATALPDLRMLIVIGEPSQQPARHTVPTESWRAFTDTPTEPTFESVPFDHPLCVLFSSGTTGGPKGIVHGHGGLLIDHIRHHALHLDLGPTDRFFFYTTPGWMIWNWLIAGLLVGSTIVLYDGSPRHPTLDAQFAIAAREHVTFLGTSAGYLTACAKAELTPQRKHDLADVRSIVSTGSPLPAETYHWVADNVGNHIWLVSTSGGTDICSALVSGCPLLPVRAGEIQCRCLGAAVDVFDENGRVLTGRVGELVITEPLPSMPVQFWNDPTGDRYRSAYFEDYPGAWRHGDWAILSNEGSIVILGRSDSTLNRQGVRIGTAEIYAAVERLPEVADSLVIGIEEPGGGYWMPLFVTLEPNTAMTPDLQVAIKDTIRSATSPRHVPDEVWQVPGIPRTLTGKKLEVPVKRILMGTEPSSALNPNSVVDPVALEFFVALARQRQAQVRARTTS
jgi:acetoacetyl-CoA synthetase